MEIKKSTVKNVQSNGTWEGKFGVMYKYEIEMTNGDTGQYMSKSDSQDKFKKGDVVDYEWHPGDFPKIKPDNSDYNKKFGDNGKSYNKETREVTQNGRVIQNDTQNQIIRQSSIRTASEFCRGNCTIDELLDNAEIIYQWCRTGEKVDKKQDLPF